MPSEVGPLWPLLYSAETRPWVLLLWLLALCVWPWPPLPTCLGSIASSQMDSQWISPVLPRPWGSSLCHSASGTQLDWRHCDLDTRLKDAIQMIDQFCQ